MVSAVARLELRESDAIREFGGDWGFVWVVFFGSYFQDPAAGLGLGRGGFFGVWSSGQHATLGGLRGLKISTRVWFSCGRTRPRPLARSVARSTSGGRKHGERGGGEPFVDCAVLWRRGAAQRGSVNSGNVLVALGLVCRHLGIFSRCSLLMRRMWLPTS